MSLLTTTKLKERGWTDSLIKTYLGDPDKTRPNPHYRSGSPMKLYSADRVAAAEQTPEFSAAKASAATRSRSAVAAAGRRRSALLAEVEAIAISIPSLSEPELRHRAIKSWQNWNADWGSFGGDGRDADPQTKQRWMVNYLRHECTEYDSHIAGLFKRVGKAEAYKKLKARILDTIAEKYKYLAAECRRQKAETEGR